MPLTLKLPLLGDLFKDLLPGGEGFQQLAVRICQEFVVHNPRRLIGGKGSLLHSRPKLCQLHRDVVRWMDMILVGVQKVLDFALLNNYYASLKQ